MKDFFFFILVSTEGISPCEFGTTHFERHQTKCVTQMGKWNKHTFLKLGAELSSQLNSRAELMGRGPSRHHTSPGEKECGFSRNAQLAAHPHREPFFCWCYLKIIDLYDHHRCLLFSGLSVVPSLAHLGIKSSFIKYIFVSSTEIQLFETSKKIQ